MDPLALLTAVGPWAYAVLFAAVVADGLPFVGAAAPGYALVAASAVAARMGALEWWLVAAAAVAGALLGDLFAFWLGRKYAGRLLARLPPKASAAAHRLRDVLAKHLGKGLVAAKFFGPSRALAAPLAGASDVSVRRFLAWSALAGLVWAARAMGVGVLLHAGLTGSYLAVLAAAALVLAAFLVGRRLLGARPSPDPAQ